MDNSTFPCTDGVRSKSLTEVFTQVHEWHSGMPQRQLLPGSPCPAVCPAAWAGSKLTALWWNTGIAHLCSNSEVFFICLNCVLQWAAPAAMESVVFSTFTFCCFYRYQHCLGMSLTSISTHIPGRRQASGLQGLMEAWPASHCCSNLLSWPASPRCSPAPPGLGESSPRGHYWGPFVWYLY